MRMRSPSIPLGMWRRTRLVHFVGIGGIGMSGIAEVLLDLGFKIRGSDLKDSETARRLSTLGADTRIGHRAENVDGVDVVVISSAVKSDNVEVAAAHERKVPVIRRAEMLAELMRLKFGIAIGGTHGKTTTTSMVASILAHAGLDPTVVVGGKVNRLGTNAKLGEGAYLVAEADESDGSFLHLTPAIAVVTNIDPEHLDYYKGGLEEIRETFVAFVNRVPFYGLGVLCSDHPVVQSILGRIEKRSVTYGLNPQADFQARNLQFDGPRTSFDLFISTAVAGGARSEAGPEAELPAGPNFMLRTTLRMLGFHNVRNALAAFAVAHELGVRLDVARAALEAFDGVERRFTVRGVVDDIMVVDDYGHHPEEIRVTLEGARRAYPDRRIVVVFQPHRYTRTRDLIRDFATAFNEAEILLLTPIYSAGEEPIPGISSETLIQRISEHGHRGASVVAGVDDATVRLAGLVRRGDLVITFGAGDIWRAGQQLLDRYGVEAKG